MPLNHGFGAITNGSLEYDKNAPHQPKVEFAITYPLHSLITSSVAAADPSTVGISRIGKALVSGITFFANSNSSENIQIELYSSLPSNSFMAFS